MTLLTKSFQHSHRPVWLLLISTLISFIPHLDRTHTELLGPWALVAPLSALWLASIGGFWLLRTHHAFAADRREGWSATIMIAVLLVIAGNVWTVAVRSIVRAPVEATNERLTSDLNAVLAGPGLQEFISAGWPAGIPSKPNLSDLDPFIERALANAHCRAVPDTVHPGSTAKFVCEMAPSVAPELPGCQFEWHLTPTYEGSELASVEMRDDVLTKFPTSGYGRYQEFPPGAPAPVWKHLGVAFVACMAGGLQAPSVNWKWNLHVAFVLQDAAEINTRDALFRTVGFDWMVAQHFAEPYIAEVFALASLFRVSEIIFDDTTAFAQTLTSASGHDLFDASALAALRGQGRNNIRVSNVSDGQLGNSRGSCLLVAKTSGLRNATNAIHVAPSASTIDLATSDRSLVVTPAGGRPASIPCTIVSALVTRDMSGIVGYPAELTGPLVNYRSMKSRRESQRIGYNLRGAGLTLHLLGFKVSYISKTDPDREDQVGGLWPRQNLLPKATTVAPGGN